MTIHEEVAGRIDGRPRVSIEGESVELLQNVVPRVVALAQLFRCPLAIVDCGRITGNSEVTPAMNWIPGLSFVTISNSHTHPHHHLRRSHQLPNMPLRMIR